MKRSLLIMGVAFVVTLTTIFGVRASADALAVVLGVVLGVMASVPTTFLVTYILTRPRSGYDASQTPYMSQQPPVVVINAPEKPAISAPSSMPSFAPTIQTRKWTVIGDTDTET